MMETTLHAVVRGKDVQFDEGDLIVCNNDDFCIHLDFDDSWDRFEFKTARFVTVKGKETSYIDVVFEGNEVNVPVLCDVETVFFGVFADDIISTTKTTLPCKKSILCDVGYPTEPAPEVYAQIMALFSDVKGEKGDPGMSAYESAVKLGFEGSEEEWLESLKGEAAAKGYSAYEVACQNGFKGSEEEWLESLHGETPEKGVDYFTESDKADLVSAVLASLPVYRGEVIDE